MIEEIRKALEALDDWTRLRDDGTLETNLRDPFDGTFYGRAAITMRDGRVHVDAWGDDPDGWQVFPQPDWIAEYEPDDPKAIVDDFLDRCLNCGLRNADCQCDRCHRCGAYLDRHEEPYWCDYCHFDGRAA